MCGSGRVGGEGDEMIGHGLYQSGENRENVGRVFGLRRCRWGVGRQQPTSGGTVRSPDLQIVVISSLQTVSSTVFRFRVSLQRLN